MTDASSPLSFQSVLVTGAAGFVGRALVPVLAAALPPGARLTLAGQSPSDAVPQADACWIKADLRRPDEVKALVDAAAPDLVVHLAALSSVAQSGGDAGTTWAVNLGGSLALAAALAARPDPTTFLFASSADVYGATLALGPVDEDAPLRPASPYARSKAAAEAMLADVLRGSDRLIIVRPANHTGPGQDARFALPSFAEQIALAEAKTTAPRLRVGDLSAERDFLDVADVVDAYLALLRAASALPARSIFNVATGRPIAISALLDLLLAAARQPVTVERDPARFRSSDIPRAELRADRLRAATGWQPRRSIADTLMALLDERRARVAAGADPR